MENIDEIIKWIYFLMGGVLGFVIGLIL